MENIWRVAACWGNKQTRLRKSITKKPCISMTWIPVMSMFMTHNIHYISCHVMSLFMTHNIHYIFIQKASVIVIKSFGPITTNSWFMLILLILYIFILEHNSSLCRMYYAKYLDSRRFIKSTWDISGICKPRTVSWLWWWWDSLPLLYTLAAPSSGCSVWRRPCRSSR